MRILGPNCLGAFDSRTAYYATFSSSFDTGWPVPGRIGIASQSGAYGTHLYTLARNRGIGASLCIMTGNEADVTVGECIGWLAENPEVDVIAVYAEGIRESAGLIAAFQAARAAKKPIVMQKVGRSELGTKAAKSHTASIAGDDAVTEAVMAEFGVVRARNSEEMLDIAHTATRKIYPARNTLGVITVSGGAGVLMSDVADSVGLPMPEMPAATQKDAARPGAVLRAAQSGGCDGAGQQRRDADQQVHRRDDRRGRLRVGARLLQHDGIVAPLAVDP